MCFPSVLKAAWKHLQNKAVFIKRGKDSVSYSCRSGICLETQYFPNSLNEPAWPQPITEAGQPYHSETKFIFSVTENKNEN